MTDYDRTGVQRVRCAVESSFGTDMTSDVATNFFDMRVAEHCDLMRADIASPDPTIVQRQWQQNDYVVSALKRWKATMKCHWTGPGQLLDTATTPTKTAQTKVLEVLLGGYYGAAGSAVASGGATTGAVVTAGHGTRFREGQIVWIYKDAGTVAYARMVTSISTDTLVWWPALPDACSTGDVIANAQNVFLSDFPSGSLNVLTELAANRGDIYNGLGGRGNFSLDLTRGNLITWSSELMGPRYLHDDEFAVPIGGSAIAAGTYTGGAPIHSMNGLVHFGPTSSSTLTSIRDAGIVLNPNLADEEVNEFNGVDGIGQWQRNTRNEQTIEMTIPGTAEAYHDAFLAGTKYGLLVQCGTSSLTGMAFAATTLQMKAAPEPVAINSMRGVKLMLHVLENSKCSDKSTEQRRAPWMLG